MQIPLRGNLFKYINFFSTFYIYISDSHAIYLFIKRRNQDLSEYLFSIIPLSYIFQCRTYIICHIYSIVRLEPMVMQW